MKQTQELELKKVKFLNENISEKKYTINKKWTFFIIALSAFLMMFFLILGSLSNNRFGTHLVFNGDLLNSPLWFILSIIVISLITIIGFLKVYDLSRKNRMHYSEDTDKIFKISSFLLIGTSIWFIALSAFSFAAFNWQFFDSQIHDGLKYGNLPIALQGMVIGISVIVVLGIILLLTYIGIFSKFNMSDRLYYTMRNSIFAFIALSWFGFVLSTVAFGAMGGDANVLLSGLTHGNINLEEIGKKLETVLPTFDSLSDQLAYLGSLGGEQIYQFVTGGTTPGPSEVGWKQFIQLWDYGTGLGWSAINQIKPGLAALISNNSGIGGLLISLSNITQGIVDYGGGISEILISFAKPGIIFGVNNSLNAYLLFTSMFLILIGIVIYSILSYLKYEKNIDSMTYNISIYSIIGITFLFAFMSWITPYIPGVFENGTIFDSSLLPGLIAGPGEPGGISSAFVYFLPGYFGTVGWWTMFWILLAIPVITISYELTTKFLLKDNEEKILF